MNTEDKISSIVYRIDRKLKTLNKHLWVDRIHSVYIIKQGSDNITTFYFIHNNTNDELDIQYRHHRKIKNVKNTNRISLGAAYGTPAYYQKITNMINTIINNQGI